ncbi:MAG: hypothetical protein VST64_10770, partial [Nitrospirota bacterium]|nr:hypothetical protein [Nitrospirota bacterium]
SNLTVTHVSHLHHALPPTPDIRWPMSAFHQITSAYPPIADVNGQGAGSPLLTQTGHSEFD